MTGNPEVFTPRDIELAWEAAQAANNAFDTMRSVEADIAAVRRVAGLALEGVAVDEPTALAILETRRTQAQEEFMGFKDVAAPVMKATDSPFATARREGNGSEINEWSFATGKPLRGHSELLAFAEWRGYRKTSVSRIWNVFSSQSGIGHTVRVAHFGDYTAPEDEEMFNDPEGLRIIQLTGRKGADPRQTTMVDVRSVYTTVKKWLEYPPNIRSFGPVPISLLADYVNHALPQMERLPVMHPPKPRQERDYSREGLLDKVRITSTGEVVPVVTGRSLMRMAISRGYTAQSAPPFTKVLANIAEDILEATQGDQQSYPRWVGEGWVYMGRNTRPGVAGLVKAWGITPDAFRALVQRLGEDPKWREAIGYLSERGFEAMQAYVQALDRQNPEE